MKKITSLFVAALMLVMPAFSATISVARTKAAEIDAGSVKTISFHAEVVSKKYRSEQYELAQMLIDELASYVKPDGRFTLLKDDSMNADVVVYVSFDSFSVSDHGVTLTQEVEGETVTIKDAWTRAISGNYKVSYVRTSDDVILGSKDYKLFEGNSDERPKDTLTEPVAACKKTVVNSAYSAAILMFDTPYTQAISLEDSKTKDKALKEQMKAALKLAKGKDYEAAAAAYKEIYEATDDYAAGFNYARMLQVMNSYDEAEALLNKVSTGEKDKNVKKAMKTLVEDRDNYNKINAR